MLIFSKHAIQRALDMAVEPEEIQDAIHRPDRIGWSPKYGNEPANNVHSSVADFGIPSSPFIERKHSNDAWKISLPNRHPQMGRYPVQLHELVRVRKVRQT